MLHLDYVILRVIRHFMPGQLVRFLLKRNFIIKPGIETRCPHQAIARFKEDLMSLDYCLEGKQVMIFGYGGNLALACEILNLGAKKVFLCEQKGFPDIVIDKTFFSLYSDFFISDGDKFSPNPDFFVILHNDIDAVSYTHLRAHET